GKPSVDKGRLLTKENKIYSTYRIDFNKNLKKFQYGKAQANIQQMEEALKQGTKYRAEQKLPDLPVKMKDILNKAITMYKGYLYKAVPVNKKYVLNYFTSDNIKWDANGSIYMTDSGSPGYISFQRILGQTKLPYSKVRVTYNVSNNAVSTLGALRDYEKTIIVSAHPNANDFTYIDYKRSNKRVLTEASGTRSTLITLFTPNVDLEDRFTSIELPNIKGVTYKKIELVK
ncbi:MAG TPA: hypothetical protein VIG43_04480, partial [Kurthia sp.]